ncbi:MAG: hypothetical protein DWQ06_09005 [Calditrichaeota bacterium]|nr:MAG: hypothetical protein DWQ06_09005 [Calditrichota bacterium]
MEEYFEPDERWKAFFGIKSREEYLQNYLIKGHFHEDVPKDVVEAFITVEYLLAHSYYLWQMYDEAFRKALLTLEMAIKLKAKLLKIDLRFNDKRNKKRPKTLVRLINEICNKEHLEELKYQLNRSRKIRNSQVHPESNSYMGAVGGSGRNIRLFVVVLNHLFQNDDWHLARYKEKKKLEEFLLVFGKELLILEIGLVKGPLIYNFINFELVENTLFLSCNPVLQNTYEMLSKKTFPSSIFLVLKDYNCSESEISGFNSKNQKVRLYKTSKKANLEKLNSYKMDLEKLVVEEKENLYAVRSYKRLVEQDSSWEITEEEYKILTFSNQSNQ